MLCVGQIKLPPGLPLIQKTRLGWVVSGGYVLSNDSALMSCQDVLLFSRENSFDPLDDLLRRFWEVESCIEPIILATKEELDCEAHFVRHVVCLAADYYSVQSRSFGRVLPASLSKILVPREKVESSASLEGLICSTHKGIPRSRTYVISFCRWHRIVPILLASSLRHKGS